MTDEMENKYVKYLEMQYNPILFGQYFGQTEHINTDVVPLTRGDVLTGALLLASNNLNSIRDK